MSAAGLAFLADSLRLVLFGGKGGVGKTTCAAAAALAHARNDPASRYLLVSTDPAHSLADALDTLPIPPNLSVLELDAAASLERFRERNGGFLREIASRGTFLVDAEIDRLLGLSLPGIDELMAFLELTGWIEAGTYRLIVVDTAPTGHTLRLVEMPRLLRRWLLALDALLAKHRYMRSVFSGRCVRDEVDGFLEDLALSVKKTGAVLTDPAACQFVPVLLAERLSVLETLDLLFELSRARIPVVEAVVNRLRPASLCPICSRERLGQEEELRTLWEKTSSSRPFFWSLPLHPHEVRGAALETLWASAVPLAWPGPSSGGQLERTVPRIRRPLPSLSLPPALLVFAGKGGVGKTTFACAAALRLAELPGRSRVLLVSTDPAHSVSDALDLDVGSAPTPVCERLWAIEIDAAARLGSLKCLYTDEVRQLLGGTLRGIDVRYDREVLERLMDLSPPGLDEVMAVAALMDVFASRRFDHVVLDSAPTGHLVRLLEAPELVEGWLKAFFELLLRYGSVLRVPKTTKALVTLSKNVKAFRTLLADSARCSLVVVSLPSELALAETTDLVAACRRLQIAVHSLVLNMVPAEGTNCSLCAERVHTADEMRERFAAAFPELTHAAVVQEGDPRGVPALLELGRRLLPANPRGVPTLLELGQQPLPSVASA